MGATLDALQRLQSIDTQLRSSREQIETKRRSVEAHRRKIATLQRQSADAQDAIRRTQAEADRLELDRKSQEAHLTKLREALNHSKTNKEYAAILTQLNTDKADALKLEDQVLAALTKVDDLKKAAGDLKAQLEKEQARVAQLEKAARETEQKLSGQLTDLEAQREEAAEGIPAEALNMFERACEHHEGEGLAMIEQPHPKRAEYVCSGCYMSVPLESINALQSRDAIITCHNCSRILFLESQAITV
jgi:predicted  nucleic acid-binding Zn-ribbon protein